MKSLLQATAATTSTATVKGTGTTTATTTRATTTGTGGTTATGTAATITVEEIEGSSNV